MRRRVVLLLLVAAAGFVPAIAGSSTATTAGSSATSLVVVRQSGWSDRWSGNSQFVSYGLVLVNRSTSSDALQVRVDVTIVGRNGFTIDRDSNTVPLIPAGGTFYFGSEPPFLDHGGKTHVQRILVSIHVGETKPKGRVLPRVTNARMDPSHTTIEASVTNPYRLPIDTTDSRVFVIYFDRLGHLIGGETNLLLLTDAGISLAPKHTSGLQVMPGLAVSWPRISRVRISIDPVLVTPHP